MGDKIAVGRIKIISIYNEDCVSGMAARLRAKTVDVVVTSPPYNIGINYKSYNDKIPREDYLEWMAGWGRAVRRVLKDGGSVFLNIGYKPTDPTFPFQVLERLRDEFELQNVIHWIKSIALEESSYGEDRLVTVGHFKPINSPRFLNNAHEYIFHLTKKGDVKLDRLAIGVPYKDRSNIDRWKSGGVKKRCRGNCWFIPYKTIQSRDRDRPHPASFPPQLAENCIRLHGIKKGMIVLDPFMGLGNTGIACRQLGIKFMGFEIDPHYFKIADKVLKRSRSGNEIKT